MIGRIQLFQAPTLTSAHRCMGVAAILGAGFVVFHLVTVIVTCTVAGFDWGVNAWVLDIMGFLAGAFFAIQCGISSNRAAKDFRQGNLWICVWASMTCCVRVLDVLMLFGIVKWSSIYLTPSGAVLWSNVVSEIVFGMTFAITAFVGSSILLSGKSEVGTSDPSG